MRGLALEIGLMDELGDFETSITKAKELASFDPEEEPSLIFVRPFFGVYRRISQPSTTRLGPCYGAVHLLLELRVFWMCHVPSHERISGTGVISI